MKKQVITGSSNYQTKQQLRHQFVDIATKVRDLSKYEFVQLLKNDDLETAQQWIQKLQSTYDSLVASASQSVNYLVAQVFVNNEFVGYVTDFKKDTGRGVYVTRANVGSNIDEAALFTSENEMSTKLNMSLTKNEIRVILDNEEGYVYNKGQSEPDEPGTLNRFLTLMYDMDFYNAADIHFEPESL